MTIKQAVDVLKNLAFLSTDKEHEKCEKAISMAIKALEEIEEYRVKEFQCHLAHEEGVSAGYNKAIYEVMEVVKKTYHNFSGYDLEFMTKYGNKNASQLAESYSTLMMYEVAGEFDDLIDGLEQLKGGAT